MSKNEFEEKETQDQPTQGKDALQIDAETEAKMKELGLKAPGMIRGMMDELSEISVCFLE